ncbi:hypothetical protein ACWT_4258 [Actinoplanes sp. SE50]|uniref:DUF4129 domain-containing protein n=1 Tax=unclassified Actinoplanes TaxID=2626549 RepID=UPI00023EC4AA|nr:MULTISPECIES: DUF4129 domain-containing protein [unclassified Actinoplanes]AEV85278.1 hypothetical protein ACPL_4387 [Actinoplanes sp. SE50/110]ATO83673.1 hypothetical protein ACWT_4258 [Actinoplanes sp. SE50]SLM01081.1 hypothetical protein ACSP50_4314 [Actinoplanes sp. SE50/110]
MRGYDEFVGRIFDVVPGRVLLLILIIVAGLTAALWYWYPSWVPRRMPRMPRLPRFRLPRFPRWRLPRFRRRRRVRKKPDPVRPSPVPDDDPVADEPQPIGGLSLADRFALQGRYAEAIRERLRDTVRDLARAGVITPEPGATAAELAAAAAVRQPVVSAPLGGATEIFSEIWYGRREASPGHDARMRTLTDEVRAALTTVPGGPRP